MKGCLEFLQAVYRVFGFTFKLNLSTRPDKFIGEASAWDKAEKVGVILQTLVQRSIFVFALNCKVSQRRLQAISSDYCERPQVFYSFKVFPFPCIKTRNFVKYF